MGYKSKKGSKWERECSKLLSLWLSEGDRDDLVWRTAGSGARHTARKKKNKSTYNQAGDLCATDPEAQFFFDHILVECKRGYSGKNESSAISVLYGLDKAEGAKMPPLWQWWEKAEQEKIESGINRVVIFFKRQGKRPCLLIEKTFMLELSAYNKQYPENLILLKMKNYPILALCDLEHWLKWCSPQAIKALYSEYTKKCVTT